MSCQSSKCCNFIGSWLDVSKIHLLHRVCMLWPAVRLSVRHTCMLLIEMAESAMKRPTTESSMDGSRGWYASPTAVSCCVSIALMSLSLAAITNDFFKFSRRSMHVLRPRKQWSVYKLICIVLESSFLMLDESHWDHRRLGAKVSGIYVG